MIKEAENASVAIFPMANVVPQSIAVKNNASFPYRFLFIFRFTPIPTHMMIMIPSFTELHIIPLFFFNIMQNPSFLHHTHLQWDTLRFSPLLSSM